MRAKPPNAILLAGPNGAGKTTSAPLLLKGSLGVREYVNTDVIAQGLSAFAPERAALAAGEIMLSRIRELAAQRISFAFETTLASRSFASWLRGLLDHDYRAHMVFLWLPTADMAVARVATRVRMGGHSIPEATIRRRYRRGLHNFFQLYLPLVTTWRMYDNSRGKRPRLIASGAGGHAIQLLDQQTWAAIRHGIEP